MLRRWKTQEWPCWINAIEAQNELMGVRIRRLICFRPLGQEKLEGLVSAQPAEDGGSSVSWHLKSKDCSSDSEDTFDDHHEPYTITVMDVADDNGHPFVKVQWSQAWDTVFYVVGKKQKEGFKSKRSRTGKILDLSDAERMRLGVL